MEEREISSLQKAIERRKFFLVDRHKQSQPQKLSESLDSSSSASPRVPAFDEEAPPPSQDAHLRRPSARMVSIQIEDELGQPVEVAPTPVPPLGSMSSRLGRSISIESGQLYIDQDDDVQSHLSFVMRERLHSLARLVHRRTSVVRDGLMKETFDDDEVSLGTTSGVAVEEHKPSLMSLIGLQPGVDDQIQERTRWLPKTVNPYGRMYLIWLFIVTSAFLYNAFCVPLRSSYPYQTKENIKIWMFFDYLCDIIYAFDMLYIKPRLEFIKGGITVKEVRQLAMHYVMSFTFKLDILSLAPTDIGYLITGPLTIWRFNRALKIQSFWQLFDILDNSVSNPYAIRIARTLSYMIYIIHCNSCIYYLLSAWQAFGQIAYLENGKYYLNKWVYNNQGNAYIRCFYFTAAVATSTGNNPAPTNVIEYIYMTFSWMMGVFVFALLLGQIRDIVSNASRNREDYRRQMDMALSECKRLNLPKALTDRVRDWFIYTWEQQKTLDEKKLIDKLPLKLQTDLALSVHYNTLSKVKLFQDCDRALLRDLVLKLRPVIFLPNDWICRKGDVGNEMYIVNQGVLEVVGGENDSIVFVELKQGSVFGEISLLGIDGNNRRTASIRAKGYATLFSLSKEDLNDVIKYYPQAHAMLRRKAAQILHKDKKNDRQKEEMDLKEQCKLAISSTPKMLRIVTEVLPKETQTARELIEALEKKPPTRRNSIYPWPAEDSDCDSALGEFDYESGEGEQDEDQQLEIKKNN